MAVATHSQGLRISSPNDDMIVSLDPVQGLWTEEQYLRITDHSRRLIEYTDGCIEVLPMPTRSHQLIVRFVFLALYTFLQPRDGLVLFAPLRMQVRAGKQREPDILLVLDPNDPRNQNAFWLGADLVVEVVSEDDPERDTVEKVVDYAEARIPEYWIVNPIDDTVTVLTLQGDAYATHGVFKRGEVATSLLLGGFGLAVDAVFDAQ